MWFWQLTWYVFVCVCVCVCLCVSHLAQNPFICDCHLKWLADYLQDNPIETSGARCTSPRRLANKRIGQIKSKKFRCSGKKTWRELWTLHDLWGSIMIYDHSHRHLRMWHPNWSDFSFCVFLLGFSFSLSSLTSAFSLSLSCEHTHTYIQTHTALSTLFFTCILFVSVSPLAREQYFIPGIVHRACMCVCVCVCVWVRHRLVLHSECCTLTHSRH